MSSRAQVATNLEEIRRRVRSACERRGRDPAEITIVGASKGQPVERLRWAWEAGLRTFGENRVQEALTKIPALPSETEWHLIGPLQSNKVRKAVPAFSTVQSVDRIKIAQALDREAARIGKVLGAFLEVNLAAEGTKHGFQPQELISMIDLMSGLESLNILGLMAIPPLEEDPTASRRWFRALRELRDELRSRARWITRPGYLSMGMSQDYELAVEEGATHVRIGTALFGPREG